jgi:hypothetical protein
MLIGVAITLLIVIGVGASFLSLPHFQSHAAGTQPNNAATNGTVTQDKTSIAHEGPVSSLSWNHTTGTNNYRLLLVGVATDSTNNGVTSVTYNGLGLTKLSAINCSFGCHDELWYLVNPPSGTYAVKVTTTANGYIVAGGVTYLNVNPTNPLGALSTSTGQGQASSVSVSTQPSQLAVDTMASTGVNIFIPNASQVKLWENDKSNQGGASSKTAVTTTTTLSWTNASSDYWAEIGVAVNPLTSALTIAPTSTIAPTTSFTATPTTGIPTVTSASSVSPSVTPITSLHYSTLPPGSSLPTDAQCAATVQRSSWEPRPGNATDNHTTFPNHQVQPDPNNPETVYVNRVTGNFTGTTDEILQWGACKWGIELNWVRAQAVVETDWDQTSLGDCNGSPIPETHGCQSLGILQVRGANSPPDYPGTWPYAYQSTAFAVDYALAIRRACYDGKVTYLGNGYKAGDLLGCMGEWFSGDWYDSGAKNYMQQVQQAYDNQTWNTYGAGPAPTFPH